MLGKRFAKNQFIACSSDAYLFVLVDLIPVMSTFSHEEWTLESGVVFEETKRKSNVAPQRIFIVETGGHGD